MNKTLIFAVGATMMLSSCGTYTGSGAYTGTVLGSILGSAIGGISDGPRGSDIGTIVGMAGGAIIGGAIGSSADKAVERREKQDIHDHYERVQQRKAQQGAYGQQNNQQGVYVEPNDNPDADISGFDATNSADDRIYDFNGSDYTGDYSAQEPTTTMPSNSGVEDMVGGYRYEPTIEVRNARFVDDNQDNVISRGELCKVIFEVKNHGQNVLYDIQPTVIDVTGNKHIFISPSMHIEKLSPGKSIRYTALVKADNRLKDGKVKICVSVLQGNNSISKVTEFNIPTRK